MIAPAVALNGLDSRVSPYASFGRRLVAMLVDSVCTFLIFFTAALAAKIVVQIAGLAPLVSQSGSVAMAPVWKILPGPAKLFVAFCMWVSMGGFYYPLCHSSPWRATFGKRLAGTQVTDYDGRRITAPRAFVRALAKLLLHLGGWLTPLSALMVLFGKRKGAMHDAIARTIVVRGKASPDAKLGYWRVAVFVAVPFVLTLSMFRLIETAMSTR